MTIDWKQVLEIESFLNNLFEQYATIERLLWRHHELINKGLRVDKSKRYTLTDLQNYLISKYPKDEMIKNGTDNIKKLFELCAQGTRIFEIEEELLDINENQEKYKLSEDVLKVNLWNSCVEYTGSTSYFLYCLKSVIDANRNTYISIKDKNELKAKIKNSFFTYINQIKDFHTEEFGVKSTQCNDNLIVSDFLKITFQKLKDKTNEFMNDSRFKGYIISCEKNNYTPPYYVSDCETFFTDTIKFSVREILDIIDLKTENYFSFRLRNCESPYPEDLRKLNYGNLNIFITLHGFIHFDKIAVLKSKGELVNYIKTILADEFTVLPRESINDTYNPNLIISSKKDSSIIVGKDLLQRKLYNQYVHKFHEKVIKGFVWFSDELGGVIYDYLGFHDNNDYNGAQKNSMPFENVIFKYFIAYLEKIRRNREMEDDLNAEGYWNSKEQYETS